jgi:MFS transporter, PAT family, beta-lactamase induction signal transducer AmpG
MDSGQSKRTHPAAWVPTLYTAEGLPFVIVATVTSLMYKSMGVNNATITFWTGLMGIPWMIKPLWGPLLEMFKTKKYFVLLTQFVGGVSFGLLALSLHLPHFFAWSIATFGLIAINFSVHDTAADGVYVN